MLDGFVYNESDLPLEEHYTDTHGYTDVNFTAFSFLGKRFCPRIKGLKKMRLYRLDPDLDYGKLTSRFTKQGSTIDLKYVVENWDLMGRFYASIEHGYITASTSLKRLVAYSTKNKFHRANIDFGRIRRTEHILKYLTDPVMRRMMRQGLLKLEELHQLARDICFAKRGRLYAQEIFQQMNSCSCLTLIAACIIYWQAKEIAHILENNEEIFKEFDPKLIAHISPIGWDNVILYGQYDINPKLVKLHP